MPNPNAESHKNQPDDGEMERAWRLLEQHAEAWRPAWKASVLEHATLVHDAACFLAALFSPQVAVDTRVLRLGAILHDVGRSRAQRVVEHGVRSGEIIREAGFPEGAARIGETHIGVGLTAEEAADLGLPRREFVPHTIEERIVCYVDNLLSYRSDTKHHLFRDAAGAVQRFAEELGTAYGERVEAFMEGVEREMGPERLSRFRTYLADVNRTLSNGIGGPS